MNRVPWNELYRTFGRRGIPDAIITQSVPAICIIAAGDCRKNLQRQVSPDGTPFRPLAHPRPSGGNKALQDTGRLGQSIKATGNGKQVILEASHPGAALHQYGGTVRAKRGKSLAIPLSKEAKRVGSPRKNRFPRPLFVWVSQKGKRAAFLAEAVAGKAKGRGKNRKAGPGKLLFHYILLKSVYVPKRTFLGFSDDTIRKAERVIHGNAAAWFFGTLSRSTAVRVN